MCSFSSIHSNPSLNLISCCLVHNADDPTPPATPPATPPGAATPSGSSGAATPPPTNPPTSSGGSAPKPPSSAGGKTPSGATPKPPVKTPPAAAGPPPASEVAAGSAGNRQVKPVKVTVTSAAGRLVSGAGFLWSVTTTTDPARLLLASEEREGITFTVKFNKAPVTRGPYVSGTVEVRNPNSQWVNLPGLTLNFAGNSGSSRDAKTVNLDCAGGSSRLPVPLRVAGKGSISCR
jgi:hypothetical protein